MRHYSRYNYERQLGVEASYKMSSAFRSAVLGLEGLQTWFFITDDWCIDSAYSLPLILRAVALHEQITLHILMKEDNLEILDDYLSDGRRSIPVITGFDAEDKQLFRWGPNPDVLHRLRTTLQEAGEQGRVVSGSTIDWYTNDGHLEVEREFTGLFNNIYDSAR